MSFKENKRKIFEKLKNEGLTDDVKVEIIKLYGERGKKAIKAVEEDRVKKMGDDWIVVGWARDYKVVGEFCGCADYMINIELKKVGVDMCYHALAKRIAEITGRYKVFESVEQFVVGEE